MYLHVFALLSILLVFTCYFIFQHSKTTLHPFNSRLCASVSWSFDSNDPGCQGLRLRI